MQNRLMIRHDQESDTFRVVRLPDGHSTPEPARIVAPDAFPVESRPNSNLSRELRWYVEKFLDYPFPPDTDVAERVQDSLKAWGEQAFNALFGDRDGGRMLDDATRNGYKHLALQISCDNPRVLAWPWEALRDPKAGVLAHTCRIERRLEKTLDPQTLSENLPRNRVNILLVTARPYENDVQYRSISRLLVELIEERRFPAAVHVLRPPTLDRLREHLRSHPDFYHILHFDGHGAYGKPCDGAGSGFTFKGAEGCLIFEKESGEAHPVQAEDLSALLREHAVPVVVLNACQSGMIDEQAEDSFASVAAALLQAGVRGVVAMAYSLYVTGAQVFLPAFYRRLFETGAVARTARFGRQQMLAHPERVCVRGRHPLQDWLVPVVYQQEPVDLSFAGNGEPPADAEETPQTALPPEIDDDENPYGFIGRDGPLLELERAMRGKTAGILIHGLGGVGKTTLARGFVQWLHATQGLGSGCFWFTFNDIRSAGYVFNRMGESLFDSNFCLAPEVERMEKLIRKFRETPYIIVWDNFEVVQGIPGTEVTPLLPEEDRSLLRGFLQKLRGGKTKVIITSRSEEDWLGTDRRKIGISGLTGEERWLFLDEMLGEMGVKIDREDKDLAALMDLLNGHPLCMRVILPLLEKETPARVMAAVRTGMGGFENKGMSLNARFYATLDHARQVLTEDLRPLLIPLAFHERFLHIDILEPMARQVSGEWTRDALNRFAEALTHMGLLHDRGQNVYELHPALTGYLRAAVVPTMPEAERDGWARAFADVMGSLADSLAPKELHEQRGPFHLFGASFHQAMAEAQRLNMHDYYRALLQALAVYAQNTLNFDKARRLFEQLAEAHCENGTLKGVADAYHQIGIISEKQHDFQTAEKWYRKSISIDEKQGNDNGTASTYHQLGMISEKLLNFQTAKKWYHKSLNIKKKQGNANGLAITYHQLGIIAEEQRDFQTAEKWYRKSLDINEKCGNTHAAAITYHQLGTISEQQRDFQAAERWYRKSLDIKEKQGNEHSAASTYHQLGIIAQEQGAFQVAEKWYRKSLNIKEKMGNDSGAARTYHQMGMIAEQQEDFQTAEKWYQKSLHIKEKMGDEHGASRTYHQLGVIAQEQRDFQTAEKWYQKSLHIKEKMGDEHGASSTYHQLGRIAQGKCDFQTAEKWYQKSLDIKEKMGNKYGAASTYGQLGLLAETKGKHKDAGEWLIKCLLTFLNCKALQHAQQAAGLFQRVYEKADSETQTKLKAMLQQAGLPDLPEK